MNSIRQMLARRVIIMKMRKLRLIQAKHRARAETFSPLSSGPKTTNWFWGVENRPC